MIALVLASVLWPKTEPRSVSEPVLEAGDAAAPETPAPTAVPTEMPMVQPSMAPTVPPVSLAAPTPAPAETPKPTMIVPNGTGALVPPEEGDIPGMAGEADVPGEYLPQDGRHLVRLWLSEDEEITFDLTELLVDGHFEGEVDAGNMYIDIWLTVYDDGTADLSIGGVRMKGEER